MKQLYLFEVYEPMQDTEQVKLAPINFWKLCIDGAARNNPGPAAVGIYLLKNDQPIQEQGFYLGVKTNNQAEYLSLLIGIYYLKQHVNYNDPVLIASDSQLLVRQLQGSYKVKHPELKPFYTFAKKMLNDFNYSIEHVAREDNIQADALANKGIDENISVPQEIKEWLRSHEIVV
ncbi:MAG TPA: ribonuclease HI family protein [Candidatus Babeliales bacterium]|nr:ribonuclease HI family protein [Candidatus Babeliales bacterium]